MKASAWKLLLAVPILVASTAPARAQAFYIVRKAQVNIQTGGALAGGNSFAPTIIAPPTGAFIFSAQAAQ
jgi:hypothetical protein